MRKYTEYCDMCGCEITPESGNNGFCIDSGYSLGGWGYREDFIKISYDNVCNECFAKIKNEMENLCRFFQKE